MLRLTSARSPRIFREKTSKNGDSKEDFTNKNGDLTREKIHFTSKNVD